MNGVQKSGLVVGDEDTNSKRAKDVEEQDTPEHTADSFWYVAPWVLRLSCGHRYYLHTTERIGGIDQCREKTEETTRVTVRHIWLHSSRIFPVTKSESVTRWPSSKVNNEGKDDESNDRDDFDTRENKFGLTVNGDSKYVQGHNHSDDYRDPGGYVNVHSTVPELYYHSCC